MPTPLEQEQEPVVAFLSSPAAHGGATVERISTHGAHVFLAGDLALKLKRAVAFSFMDFSTPEKRRCVLEREFALNRVSAPDLYLEIRPVYRRANGAITWTQDGTVVDWVLAMRRFEQADLLDAMATRKAISPALIDEIAAVIAAMHGKAPVIKRDECASFVAVVTDTLAGLRAARLDSSVLQALENGLLARCTRLHGHMAGRAAAGFVRRCHGDLHLRNIVLYKGQPTPFDALEFDDNLAIGDVYYDLAFLLMDLDHRDMRSLANRLLGRYAVLTDDLEGLAALPLYMAMRAAIRARVAILRNENSDGGIPQECHEYLTLALGYLQPSSSCLVAVGGLSGTGKSAAAYALAGDLQPAPGGIVLRSDVVRKLMFETADTQQLPESAYENTVTDKVYGNLCVKAGRVIAAGYDTVVDAVFALPQQRQAIEEVAAENGVPFQGLWLEAPLEVRKQRISKRVGDASDATVLVAERQESYTIGEISWERVDAARSLDEIHQHCFGAVKHAKDP
jgi:aminoglycoside phosphotransferase family enzyme/predicted kinase